LKKRGQSKKIIPIHFVHAGTEKKLFEVSRKYGILNTLRC